MGIAFIGFGELGHYLYETLSDGEENVAGDVALFDDVLHEKRDPRAHPFCKFNSEEFRGYQFYICLGYKHLETKKKIIAELSGLGRNLPNFVHSSSYVHPTVKLGKANFIYPGCNFDRNTKIGDGNWIANGDTIAHDCIIGDCCWFGANVTLSGNVNVGDCVFIGSGATLANDISIGDRGLIGMATAVTKDVGDSETVIGNPMRVLEKPLCLR